MEVPDKARALAAGCVDYITKPFLPKTPAARVAKALAGGKGRDCDKSDPSMEDASEAGAC